MFASPRAPQGAFPVSRKQSLGAVAIDVLPKNPDNGGFCGGVPEWLKGADCKSVGLRLRWFESSLLHH